MSLEIVRRQTSYPLCHFNTNQVIQVLEGVIKYRWNALPVDQRDGMKNFISDVIVQVSATLDLLFC